jgi:hypothetical protein
MTIVYSWYDNEANVNLWINGRYYKKKRINTMSEEEQVDIPVTPEEEAAETPAEEGETAAEATPDEGAAE